MQEPHLDLTMHQSKQQVQQHQVCPTSNYIKHIKNTKLNIVLFISHEKQFSKLQQNFFKPVPDNIPLPTVWPLRQVVPRQEVLMFITVCYAFHHFILSYPDFTEPNKTIITASKDRNMSKQFTPGYKTKHKF